MQQEERGSSRSRRRWVEINDNKWKNKWTESRSRDKTRSFAGAGWSSPTLERETWRMLGKDFVAAVDKQRLKTAMMMRENERTSKYILCSEVEVWEEYRGKDMNNKEK